MQKGWPISTIHCTQKPFEISEITQNAIKEKQKQKREERRGYENTLPNSYN